MNLVARFKTEYGAQSVSRRLKAKQGICHGWFSEFRRLRVSSAVIPPLIDRCAALMKT
jgi:hypothetical protein